MTNLEAKFQIIWNNKILRYSFVVIGSAIADFWISLYSYAIAHGWMLTQALVGFLLPFVNFLFSVWFIEAKNNKERFKLTFFSAIGMVIGSSVALAVVK